MSFMEGEGIPAPTEAPPQAPPPLSPPPQGDVTPVPVESEVAVADSPASDEDGNVDGDHASRAAESIEDLRAKIVRQVEYYFSDENLPNDTFMLKYIKKDKAGFVPIALVASFRKMKKLTGDMSLIVDALKQSSLLVVSPNEKKVRRLHPLPLNEFKDSNAKLCTVLVENLPEDHSKENIQKIFVGVGNIKSICIRDPHATEDTKQTSKAEQLISSKLHALVEYETVKAAEQAVLTLNNEKDWRNGLRVQLLSKRTACILGRKVWKSDLEKGNDTRADLASNASSQTASEHHDDTHEDKDVENLPKDNSDGRRGKNRRSKAHKNRGNTGMGHGSSTGVVHVEASRPPPGPRMPDGTRGFTMGRGRPPVPIHA